MITILNTSIITAHGTYCYSPCSLEQARSMVRSQGYQSAIGHESTAAVTSTLLGVEVKMNRIQYQQQPKEVALVFKLKSRAPEGKILTSEEIEKIGYEWGVLERTDKESMKGMSIGECYTCGVVTGVWEDDPKCPACGDDLH